MVRRAGLGRVVGEGGQTPTQLQRRFQPHHFGVTQPADARQLGHVQAKESAQPAMAGQQPLRDIRNRFPANAGVGNR